MCAIKILQFIRNKGYFNQILFALKIRIHIAVTYMHTQPGIKEKFVEDLKAAVKLIMTQDDRQLGKKVNTSKLFVSKQPIFQK
jgi:hypothetical protein